MLFRVIALLRALGFLLLLSAAVLSLLYVPPGEYLDWVRRQGAWGPSLLAATYVLGCLLFVPGSILNMAAGFLFGVTLGIFSTLIGGTVGAVAAFLVGRFLARGWVQGVMSGRRRFQAIDRAVDREGFKIVLLTRLSPIYPFNLLNYAFGLTKVSLRDYVVATFIGIIPSTVMYVCLGKAARSLTDLVSGEADMGRQVLLGVGLVVTVVVTYQVMRVARAALHEELPAEHNRSEKTEQPPKGGAGA